MAVYSQFATGGFDGEAIVANESYVGAVGAYQMMQESSMNENAIFNHILGCDFVEAQADHGFVSESTFEAVNEASAKGIFSKVIEFFRKLGEKIKGIIQNMINKISAMFTKDGKQLVKKFEETIRKKMASDTYDNNFKYSWCKPNNSSDLIPEVDVQKKIFDVPLRGTGNGSSIYANKNIDTILNSSESTANQQLGHNKRDDATREENLQKRLKKDRDKDNSNLKPITQEDIDDYKEDILTALLGENTDTSSFSKDYDEKIFDSQETVEGLDSSDLAAIKNFLSTESKLIQKFDKNKREVDKAIKTKIDKAKKFEKQMDRADGKGGFGVDGTIARSTAQSVIKMGNACSACSTAYFSAVGAAIKKHYAQCRAVYIKAATYNKKAAKHEATLLEAVVDVSNYEVDQMMPEF